MTVSKSKKDIHPQRRMNEVKVNNHVIKIRRGPALQKAQVLFFISPHKFLHPPT